MPVACTISRVETYTPSSPITRLAGRSMGVTDAAISSAVKPLRIKPRNQFGPVSSRFTLESVEQSRRADARCGLISVFLCHD